MTKLRHPNIKYFTWTQLKLPAFYKPAPPSENWKVIRS